MSLFPEAVKLMVGTANSISKACHAPDSQFIEGKGLTMVKSFSP